MKCSAGILRLISIPLFLSHPVHLNTGGNSQAQKVLAGEGQDDEGSKRSGRGLDLRDRAVRNQLVRLDRPIRKYHTDLCSYFKIQSYFFIYFFFYPWV